MNYDAVIVEMLSRIKVLEEQVKQLLDTNGIDTAAENTDAERDENHMISSKVTTSDIRDYIESKKTTARGNGLNEIILIARDISHELDLRKRYPMICNAMKQCMNDGDEIVFAPASGYSSTLEIKYYL